MAEALTTLTRLVTVREIREDASGATICFHNGGHGRLAVGDANYTAHLRLARRSRERQHPVGVSFGERPASLCFGERPAITELIRADNDIPTQFGEAEAGPVQVFFQGHDGVFYLKPEHPEANRIRAVLGEALRQQARVWFIAQKPDLTLLDVVPTE